MGTFVAKLKNDANWVKLADQILNEEYTNIDLNESIIYDPNNDMAHQWFKLQNFSAKPSFLQMLTDDFDVAELENMTRAQYNDIEFIAFVENRKFYMQKISKSSFLAKKWFSWNGQVLDYQTKENVIYINSIPNCIYDQNSDELYFMDISKAYAIFGDLKKDYKEATEAEVQSFLESDIVETSNFTNEKVGVANRKRITAVLRTYESLTEDKKDELKDYIHKSLQNNELEYVPETKKFKVSSDKELRLLLYGIQRRYYKALFEEDVLVATNSTSVSNLL